MGVVVPAGLTTSRPNLGLRLMIPPAEYGPLLSILADTEVKMPDGRESPAVGSFDTYQVVSGLGKAMDGAGVALLGQRHHVAVALHGHFRAAVAEVPCLLAVGRTKGPHQERHRIPRFDAGCGEADRVDRRRQLVRLLAVDDVDDGEVKVDPAPGVGNLQYLAVDARSGTGGLRRGPPRARRLPGEGKGSRIAGLP